MTEAATFLIERSKIKSTDDRYSLITKLKKRWQMRKIDVFFYGLFMDEDLLQSKGVTPTNLRLGSVPGFQLRIANRATLVPTPSGRVFGLVASLSHAELERLYSEPSVSAYRPEAVLVQLSNGEVLAALCFNLPEPPSAEERNSDYAYKLRSLAERLNFPAEYVASIQ
jgi:Gamma-glutamyl cyclotransferase, AIG2-like